MKISVIVPCHHAIGKVEKCIASLRMQDFDPSQYEVIFIDDCSTDGTYEYLLQESAGTRTWRVLRTEANSGSPSHPRNLGIRAAVGEYVFFLDCDDTLFPDTLTAHHAYAVRNGLDVVRGYLVVDDGRSRVDMNRIRDFQAAKRKRTKIELIIRHQSTTNSTLIKRDLLIRKEITWDESLRMGEDTVFLIQVLAACDRLGYLDHPTFVYDKSASRVASSTRTYGARELSNHLIVWQRAEDMLRKVGLSYLKIRFQVGLQTSLQAIIRFNKGDIDRSLFSEFSAFINKYWRTIKKFKLNARLQALLHYLRENEFEAFFEEAKPRMVIAGYDLKFIAPMLPQLLRHYQIRVDEWSGHNKHDHEQSSACLKWAEIIFCEWLLGNAVWYSRNKRPDQVLLVRAHRFELGRDFGNQVIDANINAYVAVSVLYFERLAEAFSVDRAKIRLLPNYIDAASYANSGEPARVFNLALVGSLPSRKGLMRALLILERLSRIDSRYNLSVYGKNPHEEDWLQKDSYEREYYKNCDDFIDANGLGDRVAFKGYVDMTKAMADVGFVLSVSDDEWLPESFHLAPADGFAAGGQGVLLRWSGAEYVYPGRFICDTIDGVCEYIARNQQLDTFMDGARAGRDFVDERYSADGFVKHFLEIVRNLL